MMENSRIGSEQDMRKCVWVMNKKTLNTTEVPKDSFHDGEEKSLEKLNQRFSKLEILE